MNDNDTEDSKTKSYFCSYCSTKLYYQSTDETTGKHEYFCSKCGITFFPANQLVKRASKFETPQSPDREPLTASVDVNPGASSTTYTSKQNLSPLFEALKKAGFKWLQL